MLLRLLALGAAVAVGRAFRPPALRTPLRRNTALEMAVYSSAEGVPAALVEERDACGVVSRPRDFFLGLTPSRAS